jgi:hypothetical protein
MHPSQHGPRPCTAPHHSERVIRNAGPCPVRQDLYLKAAVGLLATTNGTGIGLNPKNLLLAIGGAAEIAETGFSGSQQAIAYPVFAVIMSVLCLVIAAKLIGDAISTLT